MSSLLERAKQRHEQHLADETLTVPIPGWAGDLAAKYKVVDPEPVLALQTARRDGSGINAAAEVCSGFLALACVGTFLRDDQGRYDPITDDSGNVIGIDTRLAHKLDQGALSTPELVGYLFGGNKIALLAHAEKVAGWMQDTSQGVDGQILGEALNSASTSPSPPQPASTDSPAGDTPPAGTRPSAP